MALYRAKAEGRGTWHFFETEMDARRRRAAASSSTCAMPCENDAFELYYQPLFDI